MSNTTRNKIIIIVFIIILGIVIFSLYKQHFLSQKHQLLLDTPYSYYNKCSAYLGQPQMLKDNTTIIPPQVLCRINNNENIELIKIDEINKLKTGDLIMLVVDAKRLIDEENFLKLYNDKITQELLVVPKGFFTLCLYYPSYLDDANFRLFPTEFNYDKLRNDIIVAACSPRSTTYNVKPIGLMGTIIPEIQNRLFGLTIVLPPTNLYNNDTIKAGAVLSNLNIFQPIYDSYFNFSND